MRVTKGCPLLHTNNFNRVSCFASAESGAEAGHDLFHEWVGQMAAFLGLDFRTGRDPADAVRVAVRLAAVYRVHCLCRHGKLRTGDAAVEALGQCCREVVRGCHRSEAIYDAVSGWQ